MVLTDKNTGLANEHEYAPSWFALRVRPRWEKVANDILAAKGYELFFPTRLERRRWSDRNKDVYLPLFPGYLFCRVTSRACGLIVTTPGVLGFVGIGRSPLPIDEDEILAVQRVVNSELDFGPGTYLQTGCRIRIEGGPLHGLDGILVQTKSRHRLAVSVTILQRTVTVEIQRSWVRAIPLKPSPAERWVPAGCRVEQAI